MSDLTLEIEKLVYGGDGLAFHDGKPVFVPFVLPGETIAVSAVQETRKLIRALPMRVDKPSEQRVEPACPHFTHCGGCHYQHMGADEQAQWKVNILAEQLRRIGGIEWKDEIPVHTAEPWNYRNRMQLKFTPDPEQNGRMQAGFFESGSHTVRPVDGCPISSPKLNDIIGVLNRLGDERRLPLSLQSLEVFADDRDESVWLTITAAGFDFKPVELTELLRTEISGILSLRYRDETGRTVNDGLGWNYWHEGSPRGAHRWRVSHDSFFQVNRHLVTKVQERVTHGLEGGAALDLFSGVGLFARALAETFERVVAVEGNRTAAGDLKANTGELDNVETVHEKIENYLARSPKEYDAVIIDPPRTGLGTKAAKALCKLAPARLVYLACDPATLARDLRSLSAGFRIKEIEMIDLFPQTYHLETLVRLERAD